MRFWRPWRPVASEVRIAEIGTGFGVGAAWLLAGMDPTASLVTVEVDAERAKAAHVCSAPTIGSP